jgi:hypothetical protein
MADTPWTPPTPPASGYSHAEACKERRRLIDADPAFGRAYLANEPAALKHLEAVNRIIAGSSEHGRVDGLPDAGGRIRTKAGLIEKETF